MGDAFGVRGPDKIAYYAQVAASSQGRGYKRQALAALDLRPGLRVVDVGCGPGTDLVELADAVGGSGSVVGVDLRPPMVEEARRRVADRPSIEVRLGDAHALPIPDRSVDRARTDRMLQHVADPAAVIGEIHRVLRPGGVACMAEPDWDGLVVDPGEVETIRRFNRFVCTTAVRNAIVGRQLARLSRQAGLEVREVITAAPVFRDFGLADKILGLSRNTERAIRAGQMGHAEGDRWLAEMAAGPFLATNLMFIVVARRP